jgi:arsenate reductase-like glutaredoxin family protein
MTTRSREIDRASLERWTGDLGWETVLNRAGTTFRKLPDADKQDLTAHKAIDLMLTQPSMIKRPMLDIDGKLTAGFKPDVYAQRLRRGRIRPIGFAQIASRTTLEQQIRAGRGYFGLSIRSSKKNAGSIAWEPIPSRRHTTWSFSTSTARWPTAPRG